jgi:hypothetical protein
MRQIATVTGAPLPAATVQACAQEALFAMNTPHRIGHDLASGFAKQGSAANATVPLK